MDRGYTLFAYDVPYREMGFTQYTYSVSHREGWRVRCVRQAVLKMETAERIFCLLVRYRCAIVVAALTGIPVRCRQRVYTLYLLVWRALILAWPRCVQYHHTNTVGFCTHRAQ